MNRNNALVVSPDQAPSVVFDIDDVIGDTCQILYECLTIETGQDVPIEKWEHHELSKVYHSFEDIYINEIIQNYDIFSNVTPIEGAREALQMFRQKGYNLHLCTARGMVENHEQLTQDWLDKHNIPHDTVTYVPFGSRKSQAYKQLDEVFSYMFDDALHNIDDAIDSQVVLKPTVVTKPWNKACTTYMRTDSLIDFCKAAGWV